MKNINCQPNSFKSLEFLPEHARDLSALHNPNTVSLVMRLVDLINFFIYIGSNFEQGSQVTSSVNSPMHVAWTLYSVLSEDTTVKATLITTLPPQC